MKEKQTGERDVEKDAETILRKRLRKMTRGGEHNEVVQSSKKRRNRTPEYLLKLSRKACSPKQFPHPKKKGNSGSSYRENLVERQTGQKEDEKKGGRLGGAWPGIARKQKRQTLAVRSGPLVSK